MLALAPVTASGSQLVFAPKKNKVLIPYPFLSMRKTGRDDAEISGDKFTSCKYVGLKIGLKLKSMCDAFDAKLLAYRSRPTCFKSLLNRAIDFFAY